MAGISAYTYQKFEKGESKPGTPMNPRLFTLIALYRRSGAWRRPGSNGERWFVWAPFSLYLGWITVATVANTAITLLDVGFDAGSADVAITAVVIAVALEKLKTRTLYLILFFAPVVTSTVAVASRPPWIIG